MEKEQLRIASIAAEMASKPHSGPKSLVALSAKLQGCSL
jgi:hypothetical protein